MPYKEVNVKDVYKGDAKLKVEDVRNLQRWAEKEPHLPKITDLQIALFLHSCYYSNELAKITIDNYFTMKTLCPEIFENRFPKNPSVQLATNCMLMTVLPERTPEGDAVMFVKMMDCNPDSFNLAALTRNLDMFTLLHLHQHGPPKGFIILADMNGFVFGHVLKINLIIMKTFLYYLQEGLPVRLKSLQFFNIVPVMDKILALMKPFIKKGLLDSLYLHMEMDSVYEFVPKEILPQDYGGACESVQILHEKSKALINDNAEFFKFQESQVADNTKRTKKSKKIDDFGIEGTFKRLEFD